MKITVDLLKSISACEDGIIKFNNTPELHDLDITNISEITVGDELLYNHINWIIPKLNGKLSINKLTYKNSDGYWEENTYDNKGNVLTYKKSNGYWEERTYDDKGNVLTFKDSNNYWEERTYDDKGNMLTLKNSYGYWEVKTYDDKGNMLTLKNSYGYWEVKTYDDKGFVLTHKDSLGNFIDYSDLKYDLTNFEVK